MTLDDVKLIVLGSAQDGGLPHAGCLCSNCRRARRDPTFRRRPASLGIVSGDTAVLIDATNAFAEHLHDLWVARTGGEDVDSYGPPETIVLTHAHTGHYVGLWQLDRSVLATKGVRVVGPPRTVDLLARNEPWAQMAREGFLSLQCFEPAAPFDVAPGVRLTPVLVPHRAEWGTDTVGLRVEGPRRSAFYLPDIDSWAAWDHDIRSIVATCDVALLDGCFWEPFHIPGVPHPPIRESLDLLQAAVADGRRQVLFTHLNHSNPVVDPDSPEAHEVRERGFGIAAEGQQFEL